MKKLTICIGVAVTLVVTALALDYRAPSLLQGQETLKLYNGTGDTAVTWKENDSYATNRTYVDALGTTVTPLATNSTTGEIYASFARPVEIWPLTTGASANISVQAVVTCNGAYTNNVTFYIQKSIDGTNYNSVADTNLFVFATPVGDGVGNLGVLAGDTMVVNTNISAAFLQGARYLKLWKIVGAANPTDAGIITVNSFKIGGFVP